MLPRARALHGVQIRAAVTSRAFFTGRSLAFPRASKDAVQKERVQTAPIPVAPTARKATEVIHNASKLRNGFSAATSLLPAKQQRTETKVSPPMKPQQQQSRGYGPRKKTAPKTAAPDIRSTGPRFVKSPKRSGAEENNLARNMRPSVGDGKPFPRSSSVRRGSEKRDTSDGEDDFPAEVPRAHVTVDEAAMLKKMIVYQDSQVLVLNKPPGLVVQGMSKQTTKSLDGMLHALQFKAAEPPRIVHRLDRDTSGLLVLARTLESARILSTYFKKGLIDKTYLAITIGVPMPRAGKISVPLETTTFGTVIRPELACVSNPIYRQLKGRAVNATTTYETLSDADSAAALVRFRPQTGRKHQIRVHASGFLNTPLLGDLKYGIGCSSRLKEFLEIPEWEVRNLSLFLHAHEIELPSLCRNTSRKSPSFVINAPIPPHFKAMAGRLGLSIPS